MDAPRTASTEGGLDPWRITTAGGKTAFVSGAVVVGVLIASLVTLGIGESAGNLVSAVFSICAVLTGCRVFRGDGEAVPQPRAWWRMTAKPAAGWILCALFALSAVSSVLAIG